MAEVLDSIFSPMSFIKALQLFIESAAPLCIAPSWELVEQGFEHIASKVCSHTLINSMEPVNSKEVCFHTMDIENW